VDSKEIKLNALRWFAVAGLACAAGCATRWTVDSFIAPEADLPGKSTFAWKSDASSTPTITQPEVAAAMEARVRGAVTSEFVRKGFSEVPDPKRADMLVSFQMTGTRRFVVSDERRIGAPSPSGVLTASGTAPPPASNLPREQSVREGSLIVFVEDPTTGRVVWRGLVEVETRVTSSEAGIRMAGDVARRIASEFPARRASP
jgi:hypothetical protein